jgi:sugar phosphate isomerase/epimerase
LIVIRLDSSDAGRSPEGAQRFSVRKLAPYLKIVHLKDVAASGGEDNVLIGRGIAQIPAVMDELHKVNYRGLVAIEYVKEGDVDADVKQEVEFARKLA